MSRPSSKQRSLTEYRRREKKLTKLLLGKVPFTIAIWKNGTEVWGESYIADEYLDQGLYVGLDFAPISLPKDMLSPTTEVRVSWKQYCIKTQVVLDPSADSLMIEPSEKRSRNYWEQC